MTSILKVQNIQYTDGDAALTIADGGGVTAASTLTSTGAFTSPGIDDNADATAITIDSAENVGIGTTPENYHANWTAIDFGDQGGLAHYDGGATSLSTNLYHNGGWKAKETGTSSRYEIGAGGTHNFYSGASASADAAVTLTNTLSIDADGAVSKPLQPRLSVWKYSAQAIAHNTYTMVKLDGTNRIANGMTGFTQSNTHTRWTASVAGDYYIAASMRWYTSSAISTSLMDIYKNGARISFGYSHSLPNYEQLHANGIFTLAANDYLELQVYQYSGGSVNLNAQDNTIQLNAYKIS
tara:strand:- start:424 stop:1311 length:888 start_codon:yes stop_codon:yes gene_type:complete